MILDHEATKILFVQIYFFSNIFYTIYVINPIIYLFIYLFMCLVGCLQRPWIDSG